MQVWQHAEIHEKGYVLNRLTRSYPHGCAAGNFILGDCEMVTKEQIIENVSKRIDKYGNTQINELMLFEYSKGEKND